jgi:glyoxylase-like metal-dependent hydrolase (beta-lactamase superfamily II)
MKGVISMKRLGVFSCFGMFVLSASLSWAQQDFSNIEISATPVSGTVHMLAANGPAGNIGVSVGDDGLLIVDDQFAPLAEKIRAALTNLSSGSLKFILNTHWHDDHAGGNLVFGQEAPIIAHTNVRKRLMTEQQIFGRTFPAAPQHAWPVITFDASVSIHFNGEEIKVVHFPHGHTDGDSIVFFTGSNVVHMGDHYFAGRFPFVDLDSGGDVESFTQNIATVLGQLADDVKIIPGHGPLSSKDDLKTYHRMLVETTQVVCQQMAADKSLDEMKKAGLPKEWKAWGTASISTEMWIEIVHRSLSRKGTAG